MMTDATNVSTPAESDCWRYLNTAPLLLEKGGNIEIPGLLQRRRLAEIPPAVIAEALAQLNSYNP